MTERELTFNKNHAADYGLQPLWIGHESSKEVRFRSAQRHLWNSYNPPPIPFQRTTVAAACNLICRLMNKNHYP